MVVVGKSILRCDGVCLSLSLCDVCLFVCCDVLAAGVFLGNKTHFLGLRVLNQTNQTFCKQDTTI